MKKQIVRILAHGMLTLSSPAIFSDWNPEWIDADISLLATPDYQKTRAMVLEACKESGCSEEKATLLMDFITIIRPKNCVEIGVFKGGSAYPILTALKFINEGHLYAVDAWSNETAVRYLTDENREKVHWSTVNMKETKLQFQEMLKNQELENYCTPIESPSELITFSRSSINPDNFFQPILPENVDLKNVDAIDFLHLDGDSSKEGSIRDARHFLKEVRPGGYILLSNVLKTVNGSQPKLQSFMELLDNCSVICEIEHDNCILLKKYP